MVKDIIFSTAQVGWKSLFPLKFTHSYERVYIQTKLSSLPGLFSNLQLDSTGRHQAAVVGRLVLTFSVSNCSQDILCTLQLISSILCIKSQCSIKFHNSHKFYFCFPFFPIFFRKLSKNIVYMIFIGDFFKKKLKSAEKDLVKLSIVCSQRVIILVLTAFISF